MKNKNHFCILYHSFVSCWLLDFIFARILLLMFTSSGAAYAMHSEQQIEENFHKKHFFFCLFVGVHSGVLNMCVLNTHVCFFYCGVFLFPPIFSYFSSTYQQILFILCSKDSLCLYEATTTKIKYKYKIARAIHTIASINLITENDVGEKQNRINY